MPADHGEFELLHQEMVDYFRKWRDEFYLREFGFKISDLERMEMLVARYSTSESLTLEGVRERDVLIATYIEVWRPRRLLLEDGVG